MSLRIPDPAQRSDLAVFAEHAIRLDPAAVIRLRLRADGLLGAWLATGFDVLACRVVAGTVSPRDVTYGADQLLRGLGTGDDGDVDGTVDAGLPMDSAWRGALPPETGFVHVDDVPAAVLADLARQGADLAREHAQAQGPPVSLLDSEVVEVSGAGRQVAVSMRCVLAMSAMGFLAPDGAGDEVVRVRTSGAWLRIDARFGSVLRRRAQKVELTIESAAISR